MMEVLPAGTQLPPELTAISQEEKANDLLLFNAADPKSHEPPSPLDPKRTIYLHQKLDGNAVVSAALRLGLLHVVQAEPESRRSEVASALRMLREPSEYFRDPLSVALGPTQVERYRMPFTSSQQKDACLESLDRYLTGIAGSATVHASLLRIADEMFTNAMYNAPTDRDLGHRFANRPRTERVGLEAGECVWISAAHNGSSIALACTDSFGSLDLNAFLRRIRDCYDKGVSGSIREIGGGAGIGSYTMYEMCSSFYVGVSPSRRTVFCCKLPLGRSFREIEDIPKSLHIGYDAEEKEEGAEMSSIQLETKTSGSGPAIKISGAIDEDVVFTGILLPERGDVTLDLSGIHALNSCGIREWIKWIKGVPAAVRIIFENCPKVVVDQMNMVDGFLPKGALVSSFFTPYFCEGCDSVKPVLFRSGAEFSHGKLAPPKEILCDKCRKPMELDVIETKYFKFLQSRPE